MAVVHSRVVASQGLSLAFGPLNMLQNRLNRKMNCAADGHERRVGHERLQRDQVLQIGELGELRVASRMPGHAQIVHRHEDRVGADKGEPEVNLGQALVHHASKHLREPVIGCGKDAEDGGHAHDQMEMANHEIGVMQRDIEHRLRQERTAQSAGDKQ